MGYCMQKNKLGHTVSTQKTIIKTDHPSLRYKPKCDGLVCAEQNRHVLAYISGWGGRFELSFFALKLYIHFHNLNFYPIGGRVQP